MDHKPFVISSNKPNELPITCDLTSRTKNKKVIIFCHGFKGFKDWGCWNLVANYFVNNGFNFLKFNFSHNGTTLENTSQISDLNTFSKNNYSIELSDITRVIDFVLSGKISVKMSNIFIIGHSRGGGIACLGTQNHPQISKLVTWAGVANFKDRFPNNEELENWKEIGERFIVNSRTKQMLPQKYQFYKDFIKNEKSLNIYNALKKYKGKLLVCYGTLDQVLPKEYALNMVKWSENSEIRSFRTNHTFGSKHLWENTSLPEIMIDLCDATIGFLKD